MVKEWSSHVAKMIRRAVVIYRMRRRSLLRWWNI